MKTYQVISRTLGAQIRCKEKGNEGWFVKYTETLAEIMESFPSGSGFDNGTRLGEGSTPERLVFETAFHHMDENGMYDGWTQHQVIITPSLEMGFRMRITGRDRNSIKEMISDYFAESLDAEIEEYAKAKVVA